MHLLPFIHCNCHQDQKLRRAYHSIGHISRVQSVLEPVANARLALPNTVSRYRRTTLDSAAEHHDRTSQCHIFPFIAEQKPGHQCM